MEYLQVLNDFYNQIQGLILYQMCNQVVCLKLFSDPIRNLHPNHWEEYLHLPIAQAADALLEAVMDAGAPDNVSLVLVLDKGAEA